MLFLWITRLISKIRLKLLCASVAPYGPLLYIMHDITYLCGKPICVLVLILLSLDTTIIHHLLLLLSLPWLLLFPQSHLQLFQLPWQQAHNDDGNRHCLSCHCSKTRQWRQWQLLQQLLRQQAYYDNDSNSSKWFFRDGKKKQMKHHGDAIYSIRASSSPTFKSSTKILIRQNQLEHHLKEQEKLGYHPCFRSCYEFLQNAPWKTLQAEGAHQT